MYEALRLIYFVLVGLLENETITSFVDFIGGNMKFIKAQTCFLLPMAIFALFVQGCGEKATTTATTNDDDPTRTLPVVECAKKNEGDCLASDKCTYDAANQKCGDAAQNILGKCAAVQQDAACNAKAGCEWDTAGTVCKETVPQNTIYTWNTHSLPADVSAASVQNFAASLDNAHWYLHSNEPGHEGLYYSADQGATWELTGTDGVLSGRPMVNPTAYPHPSNASLNTKTTAGLKFTSTTGGTTVHIDGKLFILQDKKVKWAIDTTTHNQTRTLVRKDLVTNILNQPISFLKVLSDVNGEETIVFGQKDGANTRVFFKDAEGKLVDANSAPRLFATKNASGAALTQPWTSAGLSHDGNLLLGSPAGVYEFEQANTVLASADVGKATSDAPVLFAEVDAADVNWKDSNNEISFLGSLDDSGDKRYLAGLLVKVDAGTNAPVGGTGGLAHHKGAQAAGNHAELVLLDSSVKGLSKIGGVVRLITANGHLGINDDGTLNAANDFKLDGINADLKEMMDDKTAVNVDANDNASLHLSGDENNQLIWIKGKAIYTRTKGTGTPRT